MSTIFVSHSSKDNAIAEELGRRLAEQHHPSLFLDLDPEKGIVAGQSWEQTLYRKLRACRAVIALCTDHYLRSQWCFAEIALARMEGKHIIALQVDPLSPNAKLPSILTERQFIDLRTNTEEGYRRLWQGLKEEDILGVAGEWDPKKSPYLGLNAFQEEHAPVFFGREDETRAGIELLDRGAPGLIMVLGASGSGKSSLVRAGMLPRLRREPERWLVVDPFRPGHDPFTELATSLEQAYRRYAPGQANAANWEQVRDRLVAAADRLSKPRVPTDAASERQELEPAAGMDERLHRLMQQLEELREQPPTGTRDRLQDFLEWSIEDLRRICEEPTPTMQTPRDTSEATALVDVAAKLKRLAPDRRHARVLLIIDQFEELLGHDAPDHTANRFLELLRSSLETDNGPLMALGTMRSDFLGVFQRNPALRGIDFESLSLGPMRIEGIRRVIEEPAKLGALELESGLADRLMADTETPDALPLLSFTLWKLWRDYREDGKLTIGEYEQQGGLHGSIAGEADAVLAAARREGKEDALRLAFLRMAKVTEDGNYARRPVRWDDEAVQPVHSILERFVDRRLLVTRSDGETRMVEVAHEAMFRSWKPLKTWLDNHRAELLLEVQIKRDAATWDEAERAPDTLWRGGRLQQAHELMKERALPPVEREFVLAGARRQQRQRWTLAGITLSVFAILAAAAIFSYQKKVEADHEKVRALDRARVAVATQLLAEDPNRAALVLAELEIPEQANFAGLKMRQALNAGMSLVLAADAGLRTAAFSPDGELVVAASEFGTAWVWRADGTGPPVTLDGHDEEVVAASFSPDGKRVLTASFDGTAIVWSTAGPGDSVRLEGHGAAINDAAFSPDGRRVVTGSSDRTARLWNADGTGEPVVLAGHGDVVKAVAFSPDGRRVLTASFDRTARVWNADSLESPVVLAGHRALVAAAAFSPDGDRVVTASYDSTARVWRADGSGRPVVLAGHGDVVVTAVFSPDGRHVLTASRDHTARVWDATTGAEVALLEGHRDSVVAANFSPDGKRVVTASADGTARVWDAGGRGAPMVLRSHADRVRHVSFSPDGERVLTASLDGTVRLWQASGARDPTTVLMRLADSTVAAAVSADGNRIVTASEDGAVRIRQLGNAGPPTVLGVLGGAVQVTFGPSGDRVLAASEDGTVRVWDTGGGGDPVSWDVVAAAISPDGALRVTASDDNTVRISSTDGSGDAVELGRHDDLVVAAAFSPDGKRVVTTSWDQTARVWSADGRGTPVVLQGHDGPVVSAAFSPDGKRIVTASWDSTAQVWHADGSGTPVELVAHQGTVDAAAFSPDGMRVVTASQDGTARVWRSDGTSDPVVLVPGAHAGAVTPVVAAAFSPDGDRVLTVSADGMVREWRTITHDRLIEEIKGSTNLCLEVEFRQQSLGQSAEDARLRHEKCEQERGPRAGSRESRGGRAGRVPLAPSAGPAPARALRLEVMRVGRRARGR